MCCSCKVFQTRSHDWRYVTSAKLRCSSNHCTFRRKGWKFKQNVILLWMLVWADWLFVPFLFGLKNSAVCFCFLFVSFGGFKRTQIRMDQFELVSLFLQSHPGTGYCKLSTKQEQYHMMLIFSNGSKWHVLSLYKVSVCVCWGVGGFYLGSKQYFYLLFILAPYEVNQ